MPNFRGLQLPTGSLGHQRGSYLGSGPTHSYVLCITKDVLHATKDVPRITEDVLGVIADVLSIVIDILGIVVDFPRPLVHSLLYRNLWPDVH